MIKVKSLSRVVQVDYSLGDVHTRNLHNQGVGALSSYDSSLKPEAGACRGGRATARLRRVLRHSTVRLFMFLLLALFAAVPGAALASPAAQPAATATIAYNRVNMRSGPGTSYAIVAKLSAGTEVTLLGREGSWYQLRALGDKTGWVHQDLVAVMTATTEDPAQNEEIAAAAADEPAAVPLGVEVAQYARQFNGRSYRWGAEGPNSFDCSGLTLYVYRQFGIYLPHSSRAQYSSNYGTFIQRDQIQPGDLLFYATTGGGISHVGLYLGDGQAIHALSPRQGVRITSIYTSYWQSRYVGALRPYR